MDTSPFVFDTFVSMERFLDVAVGSEADVNAVRKILSSCSPAQLLEIVNYQDVSCPFVNFSFGNCT